MERLIIKKLLEWKNSEFRKPLILDGARQVGKTWVLQEFGRRHFNAFAYLNCDGDERVKEIFASGFSKERVVRDLGLVAGQALGPDVLLILDEIQEIPEALTSLKYFCETARELPVAAAGSLLGLSVHSGTGFPVGKVDVLSMYPMTFSEFVWAQKGEDAFKALTESKMEELASLHSMFKDLLRQYYFTGGMPEAVAAFVSGRSPDEIRTIQNAILYSYNKDISKHASSKDIPRIHQVWESIPQQLAKENKKFVYGAIRSGARAKEFETAIQWLADAGTIHKVSRIRKATLPLKFYEDLEAFKLFVVDCGLLGAMTSTPPEGILVGENIFEEYKGAFTEQFVLQQMLPTAKTKPFYFSAEDSRQELDFLLQSDNRMIPIEVKAEENLRAKSLRQFVLDHEGTHGIRLSMSPYREQDWMTNYPLYAAERVEKKG
ncbi:MAG: ATP-binding protein [Fibrobacter sp.]|nr:ATP-binding protein [Fibrobacter sp.]